MTAQYKLTAEFEGTQFFYTTEDEGVEYEHKNENGEFHRLDGPAFVTGDGCEFWYKDGKKHREDGPASIYKNGSWGQTMMTWYKDGKIHREDGPAIFDTFTLNADIYQYWVNGKLHREDGPAFEMYTDDSERTEWWFNGVKHREDGPAYQSYTDDLEISEWWANGKLHRDGNQPAVCKSYMNGEVYREVYEWWVNGKRHREYGPALIVNEQEEFYLEDVEYTREQFFLLIEERNEEVKNALLENTNICKDVCGIIADYVWSLD